jgi:hypothetical protein
LFLAAIAFAAGAAYIWYTDDDTPSGPGAPPPGQSGEHELANVLQALDAENSDWDYGRTTARSEQLQMPAQVLTLGDRQLYVFIFTGPNGKERIASREAASEQIDLETMELTTPSGEVLNEPDQQLYLAEGSNVMTILVGGDQETADQVSDAIGNLP